MMERKRLVNIILRLATTITYFLVNLPILTEDIEFMMNQHFYQI